MKYSACFGQVHCLWSGVSQHCIHAIGICNASTACIQHWDTPDDRQWTCPKPAEYFTEKIWETVHLVGFYYKNKRQNSSDQITC